MLYSLLYFLFSIFLIVIDQLVKFWVRSHIPLGQHVTFIPHIMDLTYLQNTGAAFSTFSGMTWLLTLISFFVSGFLMVLLILRVFPKNLSMFSISLLLAGAIGNLIDRALFGFVTDMFATTFVRFAVFNVADVCVVLGGILFLICVFVFGEEADKGISERDSRL